MKYTIINKNRLHELEEKARKHDIMLEQLAWLGEFDDFSFLFRTWKQYEGHPYIKAYDDIRKEIRKLRPKAIDQRTLKRVYTAVCELNERLDDEGQYAYVSLENELRKMII